VREIESIPATSAAVSNSAVWDWVVAGTAEMASYCRIVFTLKVTAPHIAVSKVISWVNLKSLQYQDLGLSILFVCRPLIQPGMVKTGENLGRMGR